MVLRIFDTVVDERNDWAVVVLKFDTSVVEKLDATISNPSP